MLENISFLRDYSLQNNYTVNVSINPYKYLLHNNYCIIFICMAIYWYEYQRVSLNQFLKLYITKIDTTRLTN